MREASKLNENGSELVEDSCEWAQTLDETQSRFIVTYEINYVHVVSVGISAADPEEALAVAETAFNTGSIWDDTAEMPLLYDDYEETTEDSLRWQAEETDEFPPQASSVTHIRGQEKAIAACQALVNAYGASEESGGSIEWEQLDDVYQLAQQAIDLMGVNAKRPVGSVVVD